MTSTDERFARLSPRHRECLRLVYNRKRNKEIANELGLSVGTVSTYCAEAIRIVGGRDRIDAAEQFASYEKRIGALAEPSGSHPSGLDPRSDGVVGPNDPVAVDADRPEAAWWRQLVPVRLEGAPHNDLGVLVRLAWLPILALAFAAGFGMLADAVRVASDLVAGRSAG